MKFLRITSISFNVIMTNYEFYGYFFQILHRRCNISVSFSWFWNKKVIIENRPRRSFCYIEAFFDLILYH